MSNMLDTYSISYNGKNGNNKNFKLKFKVSKDVQVSFNQVGDVNEITLRYDTSAKKENFENNYSVTGKLNVQFIQYNTTALSKSGTEDGGDEPIKKPVIIIDGGN